MASVFVKHEKEIKLYQQLLGPVNGSILFAMSILSDVQEMTGQDNVRQEVNEAKELIATSLDFLLKS